MFVWRALPSEASARPGAFLTVPALWRVGIRVAFTSRLGGHSRDAFGSLNLSLVSGDEDRRVAANRARVLGALGCDAGAWTSGYQVHGARAQRVTVAERGAGADGPAAALPDTDGLWTDEPGIALAVLTADCVPLFLTDPVARRIGVVHAGWRGLLGGVIEAAVDGLGSPERLQAFVGPSIGPCCYEVGDEVAGPVVREFGSSVLRGVSRLNLWAAASGALRRSGVRETWTATICTRCESHRFFSHRAGAQGRQGVVACLDDGGRRR